MKSLDTNIIIRFLVNDDKLQANKVKNLFEKVEIQSGLFFIINAVLIEVLWILKSVYDYKRSDIIKAIESLSQMSIIKFENNDAIQEFILQSKKTNNELDDLLIGIIAKCHGNEPTITFDLRASKSALFELLK